MVKSALAKAKAMKGKGKVQPEDEALTAAETKNTKAKGKAARAARATTMTRRISGACSKNGVTVAEMMVAASASDPADAERSTFQTRVGGQPPEGASMYRDEPKSFSLYGAWGACRHFRKLAFGPAPVTKARNAVRRFMSEAGTFPRLKMCLG